MLSKLKLLATDWARYSAHTRRAIGAAIEATELPRSGSGSNELARSLNRLTMAARSTREASAVSRLEKKIRDRTAEWSPANFNWDAFFPDSAKPLLQKSIILKTPQAHGEKGVLFIAFEDCWMRLLRYANLAALAADYEIVLSPTWSPPHDLAMLLAAHLWPGRVHTILSNFDDEPVFARLAPNLRAIPLLASSWVNPDTFAPPAPAPKKDFDVCMIANFAAYKRHFALFQAMQRMPTSTRAVLMGRAWDGRTRATLEAEARMFGVQNRVTIMEGLPDADLIAVLHASRASVIMSQGEGACVAVAESLMANIPVGLTLGANVGSRAFINEQTGKFFRPSRVAEDLTTLIAQSSSLQPRKWMLDHGASCHESSRVLNNALARTAGELSYPWTADLAPMQWRPNAEYLDAADAARMQTAYESFEHRYGLAIQKPRLFT